MTDTSATEPAAAETYLLRLYVAGQTPKSLTAFANLRKICETHLAGRYEIEVIDLSSARSSPAATRSSPSPP